MKRSFRARSRGLSTLIASFIAFSAQKGVHAQPAPPPAAPAAAAREVPPPVVPPRAVPPPAAPTPASSAGESVPSRLAVGTSEGSFQPGALLQFWLQGTHQSLPAAERVRAETNALTFRVRRAELKAKGDIWRRRIAYQIMIDPARAIEPREVTASTPAGTDRVAKTRGPLTILQDFFITFPSEYADLSLGQFKVPLSMEGYGSSAKLLFPERAAVSRRFGDKRDLGIRVEKKLGDHFGYYAGVFNGTGVNVTDDDTEKDGGLRLELYPFAGLTVAGVGYATLGKRERSSRDRLEVDLRYDAHSVYLLAEHIRSWETNGGNKAVRGHGTYVQAAYTFFGRLQPMLRVGDLEPDTRRSGDHFWHYEAGANWLLAEHEAKASLAFAYFEPTRPTPPANSKKTELTLAMQVAF